jgi:uncharacterized protein
MIVVRRPGFVVPEPLPKHPIPASPLRSHLVHAFNLIFPDAERFLVRTISRSLPGLAPELAESARALMGQEAQHAIEHAKTLAPLRATGYRIDGFLRAWRRGFSLSSRWAPTWLNLANCAAAEHFATQGGAMVLRGLTPMPLDPALREMALWHAAEEIEHKSVAIDVYRASGGGGVGRRVGLVMVSITLGGGFVAATTSLLWQDGLLFSRRTWADLVVLMLVEERLALRMAGAAITYAKPGFHPSQDDNDHLATTYFRTHEVAPSVA